MNSHSSKRATTQDKLAELDQLIRDLSKPPAETIQQLEDTYFDEIIEMLRQADLDNRPEPVTTSDSDDNEFFNQIMEEIAEQERLENENQTIEMIKQMTKKIDDAKENIVTRWNNKQYMKKVEMEITDPAYSAKCIEARLDRKQQEHHDNLRIAKQLTFIQYLVKQLPVWSPTRSQYTTILKDQNSDTYLKVQRLIQAANKITEKFHKKEYGLFTRHLFDKSSTIHETIAGMDINEELASMERLGIHP